MSGFISQIAKGLKKEWGTFASAAPRAAGVAQAGGKIAAGVGRKARSAGKLATLPVRSNIAGTLTGAAAGGAYGYASSDYDSSQLTFESALGGAMVGAAAGLGVSSMYKATKMGASYAAKNVTAKGIENFSERVVKGLPGAIANTADKLASNTGSVINFAARHPATLAGAAGTAYMAGSAIDKVNDQMYGTSVLQNNPYQELTDTQMNTSLAQEENATALLQSNSVAPMGGMMPARRMLMGSTQGLVQGLHRGRHRG